MSERIRKRGVIASRAKLETAMQAAGLKTQASLAKKIADLEGLDGEPRAMVGKAFRGKPIEHHTLARIAVALEVEVFSLYLSSDEVQHEIENTDTSSSMATATQGPIPQQQSNHKNPQSRVTRFVLYASIALVLLAITIFLTQKIITPTAATTFSLTKGEKTKLIIVGLEDTDLDGIKTNLAEQLALNFDVSISSILKYSPQLSPWELPNKLSVDYVININTVTKGTLKAIFIDILTDGRKVPLFADVWSVETLPEHANQISANTTQQIKQLFGLEVSKGHSVRVDKKAVLHYMDGINVKLEGTMSLALVNQALNHFQLAIDLSPHFIKAQAAKCFAFSDSYHLTRDIGNFKQAIKECEKFAVEGKNNSDYNAAMGSMYRRIGNLDKAILHLKKTLEYAPQNTAAYIDLALSQFYKGTKSKDKELIKRSLSTINEAIELSPDRWITYHAKSTIQYSSGDSSAAIVTQEKAVSLARNTTTVNNLASFHFCSGKMSRAKELFKEVLSFKDIPLTAKYNLASVYSFYLENERAAQMMEEYLNEVRSKNGVVPADALIGLADIYNQLKSYNRSRENYQLAYKLIEAERLNGQGDPRHEVHRTYIEIALGTLDNTALAKNEINKFTQKLNALEKLKGDPNVKVMLIFGWSFLDNLKKAENLFKELTPQCPAMADAPIFEKFRRNKQVKL